jgi:hypothetical protein
MIGRGEWRPGELLRLIKLMARRQMFVKARVASGATPRHALSK